MGSINAIPEYQSYYHLGADGAASTGLVFSIFQIGQMVGALFTWICDWQGRKIPIFGGCFGVVVSTIITVSQVMPMKCEFLACFKSLAFCSQRNSGKAHTNSLDRQWPLIVSGLFKAHQKTFLTD